MSAPSSRTRLGSRTASLAGRLSFANVVSVVALFVALRGSSYAVMRVGSAEIADNSIRGRDIHENTIRAPMCATAT
ncbi:MAG: hypothetical protein H0T69_10620 [Thermoleophilaceae bacterium]|nr:hypothetical protein [Thermoleophilaceae bacterium]